MQTTLREFCNITIRKYIFEHEIQNLTTALLYFLYINENSNLNFITKELAENREIIIYSGLDHKNKIIQKEAGSIF